MRFNGTLGSCRMTYFMEFRMLSCPITPSSSSWLWTPSCRTRILDSSSMLKVHVRRFALHSCRQQRQYIALARSLFFWYLKPLYIKTFPPRFPTIILAAIIAIMVLIIERIANRLYIYSTQEMNLIGPLYDTLFLNEKCHSKWHFNSNDTHVYILQINHTGIRTMWHTRKYSFS